jgi:hypothetical protein
MEKQTKIEYGSIKVATNYGCVEASGPIDWCEKTVDKYINNRKIDYEKDK